MTEFVEVKTQDLSGAALDWAVAKAEGMPALIYPTDPHYVYIDMPGRGCGPYMPSHAWFEGGPLIEKYKLDIGAPMENQNGPWNAATEWAHPLGYKGDTPLIAACRAIVASILGETVSVPKELLS
ncbi:phage protein NinX family protein [Pseudomonas canadensis]|uniref:phage protein NinX family protein n=1 Tax=Pseudomonas canadensis TaxID=915099 RepID=UPI0030D04550